MLISKPIGTPRPLCTGQNSVYECRVMSAHYMQGALTVLPVLLGRFKLYICMILNIITPDILS
jgi:hypothetical protein